MPGDPGPGYDPGMALGFDERRRVGERELHPGPVCRIVDVPRVSTFGEFADIEDAESVELCWMRGGRKLGSGRWKLEREEGLESHVA